MSIQKSIRERSTQEKQELRVEEELQSASQSSNVIRICAFANADLFALSKLEPHFIFAPVLRVTSQSRVRDLRDGCMCVNVMWCNV